MFSLVCFRFAAVLLLSCVVIGGLAGCGGSSPDKPASTQSSATTQSLTESAIIPVGLEATVREIPGGAPVPNGGWLIPGHEYRLDVVVRDADELVHFIGEDADSARLAARLTVRASGLEWDATRRTLKAAGQAEGVPGGVYGLIVELTGGAGLKRTYAFHPDWPAVRDLQPEDVADLSFSVHSGFSDGALFPGEPARFAVVLKDERGREYSSDEPKVRQLLAGHLSVHSEAVLADLNQYMLTINPEWFNGTRRQYAVELLLSGIPVRAQRTFLIPPLAYAGPEPEDVAALDVPIQGLNPDDTLDPGKPIPLQVRVTDKKGHIFVAGQRRPGELPLPWSRLSVRTENMRADFEHDRLVPEADLVKIAGKSYQLTVTYAGRKALTTTLILKPFPYAWYRDRMLTEPQIGFSGEAGLLGQPGRVGSKGEDGQGTPGHPGQPGGPGAPGQRGPDIIVSATLARTFDSLVDLIFIEVATQGKRTYSFRKLTDPPLKIVSIGGKGGTGGSGGAGGAGGNGSGNANGADGGPGGSGGPGGAGGDGGDIQLFLSRPDLQRHFVLESAPGPEGAGGAAGAGGAGGKTGQTGTLNGRQGAGGFNGPSGQPGRPGQVSTYTGGPSAELNNNPPSDYKQHLFFANFRVGNERKLISGSGDSGRRDPAR
jgi:hypothetical protein